MELIPRELQASIAAQKPPKAVVIFGARQTGKTTLLQGIVSSSAAWFSGDVPSDLERLSLFS
ncbi:ATP-binding protein [Sutterella faecalis]|uniref:ATP-binding protein n=2 Tax=Sutterella TaxID=40544 RepID=A0AAI9SC01_9BURK|nr:MULTISPECIES: ATP-binding protein [Sutterella]KAB7650717.1 ATP-binding protein [Sutterella seckii]QDA55663.1 ATP-binding protein [Sutterella faecalis]